MLFEGCRNKKVHLKNSQGIWWCKRPFLLVQWISIGPTAFGRQGGLNHAVSHFMQVSWKQSFLIILEVLTNDTSKDDHSSILVIVIQSHSKQPVYNLENFGIQFCFKLETCNFPRKWLLIWQRSASRGVLFWRLDSCWGHGKVHRREMNTGDSCWAKKTFNGFLWGLYTCIHIYHVFVHVYNIINIESVFAAQELATDGCSTPIQLNWMTLYDKERASSDWSFQTKDISCMFVDLVSLCTEGICNFEVFDWMNNFPSGLKFNNTLSSVCLNSKCLEL